ncbi:hypothetical protein [Acidipropionibacterium timonense]|uniref:hypothetical protein n=1 Tax=Acidipropionibacterium timonense TaxID=2161818 RepID=UPI001032689F|nr:hypothetical protein [Acidipropionibacterium timonense]
MTEHLSDDYIHRQIPEPILLAVARQREAMRRAFPERENMDDGIVDAELRLHESKVGPRLRSAHLEFIGGDGGPSHVGACIVSLTFTARSKAADDTARWLTSSIACQFRWLEDIIRREPGIARVLPGSPS